MIDTTELRRLRDAAIEGPLVISARHMQVMSATTEQFVSCTADDMNDPEFLLICYAFNNAHAIADELDALRKRVAELEDALRTIQHHLAPNKDYCREVVAMATKALGATDGN